MEILLRECNTSWLVDEGLIKKRALFFEQFQEKKVSLVPLPGLDAYDYSRFFNELGVVQSEKLNAEAREQLVAQITDKALNLFRRTNAFDAKTVESGFLMLSDRTPPSHLNQHGLEEMLNTNTLAIYFDCPELLRKCKEKAPDVFSLWYRILDMLGLISRLPKEEKVLEQMQNALLPVLAKTLTLFRNDRTSFSMDDLIYRLSSLNHVLPILWQNLVSGLSQKEWADTFARHARRRPLSLVPRQLLFQDLSKQAQSRSAFLSYALRNGMSARIAIDFWEEWKHKRNVSVFEFVRAEPDGFAHLRGQDNQEWLQLLSSVYSTMKRAEDLPACVAQGIWDGLSK